MRSILFSILISLAAIGHSQSGGDISGRITDVNGDPLPFATIYEDGTSNGTTSNAEGYFQLSLSSGERKIVAQFVGYQRQVKTVIVPANKNVQLDFTLQDEALVLKEVIVSANEKDQARQIIRNTIKKRKYYANEVAAYACEVYIKGLQRLDKKPDRVLGISVDVDTGIVYLSESISKLKFQQPDKVSEVMISSKVSGNNSAFSYNQASEMLINLYENTFYIEGLSERPFVSPIANNAFLFYDYKVAGTIIENGQYIFKIKVIPKRSTDPVFSGHIYIIEDSWRLYSVDVMTTKSNGIEFIDTLNFNQVFAPVGYDIWMPLSQRFTFKFKAFGFEGSGHFTAIYRNYKIQPNYYIPRGPKTDPKPEAQESDKKQPEEPPIEKPKEKEKPTKTRKYEPISDTTLFTKKDFSKAIVKVEDNANQRDSAYWAKVRPIPLTKLEIKDYKEKDSLREVKESKPYLDSVDQVKNKFKLANLAINGYTYYNSYEKRFINFPTLTEGLQYNSVEGLVLNFPFSFIKRTEDSFSYRISPTLRYGFANNTPQFKVEGLKLSDRKKSEMWQVGLGRFIFQLNEQNPIGYFANSYITLVEGRNLVKIYQKSFGYLGYQRELINGLLMTSRISYEHRNALVNHAFYNIRDKPFTSNHPQNVELNNTGFERHEAFYFSTRLRIRFDQKYIDRPDRKINLKSKYPDLYVYYKKGIPLLGSEIDYDLIKVGLDHKFNIGLVGTSEWSGWAGKFLNSKTMYFPDYMHFNGNQSYIRQMSGANLFQILDYYQFSTNDQFALINYEHHFNEFIFNKIPYVKRLDLQAVGSVNYLTTPTLGQYFEFGAGIEHIFKFIRVDFYTAIRNGNHYGSGFKLGVGF
ncbi:MAG: DUF5686 and carboxypeptidase regulatory-like domain-containing protein [Marinoscillum sp.]